MLTSNQMARDKKGKGRAASPEIESPSSDSEETHDASPPPRVQPKRKVMATKIPKRAQGVVVLILMQHLDRDQGHE